MIATIAETFPHLVPELPAFYALLKYQKSHARLIITEDFSCGGTLSVSPLTAEVPREIRDIRYMFPSWGIPLFELEKMCFLVNNTKRRLGDFDPLGSVGSSNVLPLVDVIFKAPKPHTVSVQSLT